MKKTCITLVAAAGALSAVGCIAGSSAAWPAIFGNSIFGVIGSFVIDAVVGGLLPAGG